MSSLLMTEIEPATSSIDCSTLPPTTTTVPSSWPSSSLFSSSSLLFWAIAIDEVNANSIDTKPAITLIFVISHLLRSIMTFPHALHCRSEEHTSELQSRGHLVCRLLLE